MTGTGQALLAAVIDDPADDLPRLAMADWLEEHGDDARAEFIRVQCELGPLRPHGHGTGNPHGGDCPVCFRAARLEGRERKLLSPWRVWAWLDTGPWGPPGSPLACHQGGGVCRLFHAPNPRRCPEWGITFRRGFVGEVTLPCAAWLAHGPALVRAAPLGRVTLAGKGPVRPAWTGTGPPRWWYVRDGGLDRGLDHALPACLFRPLARLRRWDGRTSTGLGFATPEAARLALSESCLAWARAAAVAPPPAAGV